MSRDSKASLTNETHVQKSQDAESPGLAFNLQTREPRDKAEKHQDHQTRVLLINARTAFTN